MTKEDFDKLKKQVELEMKLDPSNITAKSISLSNLNYELLAILSNQKRLLNSMKIERDRVYGKLYHYYKFGRLEGRENFAFSLDSKSEIESYIKSDDVYYKLAISLSQQEIIVDYLDQIIKSINSINYNIRNYVELQKFTKGIY